MNDFWVEHKEALILAVSAVIGGIIGLLLSGMRNRLSIKDLMQPLWVSIALYFFFGLYWVIAARNTAAAKSSEARASFLLHQVLLNVSLMLLFVRIPGLKGRWLPVSPFLAPVGIAIQAGSTILAIWARRHLGRNWSAAITAKVDHQLIRSGPYRFVRHPIYTAMFGMYVGIALASGEWHALVGVIMLAVAYWRKIRLEERNLRTVFGSEYDAYRRDSWALIPGLL
jgi:protein-S-isoprenylcysteine O-methyltransferase Ste14